VDEPFFIGVSGKDGGHLGKERRLELTEAGA
jgi:hypothetical protein